MPYFPSRYTLDKSFGLIDKNEPRYLVLIYTENGKTLNFLDYTKNFNGHFRITSLNIACRE